MKRVPNTFPLHFLSSLAVALLMGFSIEGAKSSSEDAGEGLSIHEPKIMGPVELNPIFDFVHAGRPVSAKEFLSIFEESFGRNIFTDPGLNELVIYFAEEETPHWSGVLQIAGQGDPLVETFLRGAEQSGEKHLLDILRLADGEPLEAHKMSRLLGLDREPKAIQLLSLIQRKGTFDLTLGELLGPFGYERARLLPLIDLVRKGRSFDTAKIVGLVGAKDPEAAAIVEALSVGRKLSVSQVLKLLSRSVHPKVAALISLVGHRDDMVSIYDLVSEEGAYRFLIQDPYHSKILSTINSSSTLGAIFRRYSRVPLSSVFFDSKFFRLSSLLNEDGKRRLEGALRSSQSLKRIWDQGGQFFLEDILSDGLLLPSADDGGIFPITISSLKAKERGDFFQRGQGARLAVTGSFRGSFGAIHKRALEVLRIANIGTSPAKNISFDPLLEGVFQVDGGHCEEILLPGQSCELMVRARGQKGRFTQSFVIRFFDGQGAGEMKIPLDVLIVDEMGTLFR
ncbi:MAG: hypothetical protein OXB88_04800 [Bacteriovoracales bacterium]|nr:hypothetical protein [Bacteriovoracales bacterium]